jgi:MoxR-like ATPase
MDEAGRLIDRLQEEVLQVAVVDPQVLQLFLVTILARGHLLLEDIPGMGKTLVAPRVCHSG